VWSFFAEKTPELKIIMDDDFKPSPNARSPAFDELQRTALWRARAEAVKYPEFPAGGDLRENVT